MKKIIDGFRYDTEKARLIGRYDNIDRGASSTSDFNYWEAGLYRTLRSGQYFLAGEGGAMSRFSRPTDGRGGLSGGSKIIPLTPEEAFSWAESYLPTEIVEKEFADQITD